MSNEYVGTYWRDEHGHRFYVQGWSRNGGAEEVRLFDVSPKEKTIGVGELEQNFTRESHPSSTGSLANSEPESAERDPQPKGRA